MLIVHLKVTCETGYIGWFGDSVGWNCVGSCSDSGGGKVGGAHTIPKKSAT